jgi:hypothetical protein
MSVTGFVIWFIFMAVSTMTILVVGTLGAADLLHRPHRRSEAKEHSGSSPAEQEAQQSAGAQARQDSESKAAPERSAELVEALMPLGSNFSYVVHPNGRPAADSSHDHEDPPHGRAA